jgi:hypothetical protein
MQKTKSGKKSKVGVKALAIVLAGVVTAGVFAGTMVVVNNKYNPQTLDGTSKKVVGFTGLTNSSGVLTYTGDYEKYNDIATQSENGNLLTLTTDDTLVTVTSPLDTEWPYSEIKSVKDSSGNVFTAFPKMYISYSYNEAGYLDGVSFANYEADDSYFISDAYLNPDGSGQYCDYFYIGAYEGSGTKAQLYSVADATPLGNISLADARKAARVYGTTTNFYNGYQQLDITMWNMYAFLVSMYLKTDDVQSVYPGPTNLNSVVTTGTTAHISTMNGWNTSTCSVKFLGVENAYGSIAEWCDGIFFSGTSIYYESNPCNYENSFTTYAIMEFKRPTTSGYIVFLKSGTSAETRSVIFPALTVASESEDGSNYMDDLYSYASSGSGLIVGCCYSNGVLAGLFSFNGSRTNGTYDGWLGSRLCGRNLSDLTEL